ncbi:ATP-dependent clp protease proteolytic subunit-related protein 1 [Citrus sinensis]|uniref:ATP-dependent clp protease proteolytic subunit-related protein 1 n=1 Tax=Citrus sinensis TaxID=2711 RepID=A0ACB8IE06_CITSI|nr:ATP-dependent clp protease proteolytic subunit-related protein 1 [Citrus sinensis]
MRNGHGEKSVWRRSSRAHSLRFWGQSSAVVPGQIQDLGLLATPTLLKNVLRAERESFVSLKKKRQSSELTPYRMMDNYKNVPRHLYGLTPSQMDMFMTEENPVCRQAASVTEETISSAHHYLNNGGMWSLSGMSDRGPSKYSMSVSMYRGGGGVYDMPQSAPPDLPSLLLDARIVYLGMPIVSAVTELLIAQFMWLDFDNASKPIYLYINSSGTQNEKKESVGAETDAYAIADAMAVTKLYLPVVGRSSGPVTDMWRKAKDLEANAESYIELLAKGTGKPKEEIAKDIQRPKYMQAKEAIAYGLADKIIDSQDAAYEKRVMFSLIKTNKFFADI